MTSTFPSRILTILDLPEPKELSAKFQYNFFVKDELINDTGNGQSLAAVDDVSFIKLRSAVPRFVKITWSPVTLGPSSQARIRSADVLNAQTVDQIQSEQSFSNFDFSAINFQDFALTNKLFQAVSGSISIREIQEETLSDAVRILNDDTRETVDGEFLFRAVGTHTTAKKLSTFEKIEKVGIRAQINNKVIGTVVWNAAEDLLGPFSKELTRLTNSADGLQQTAVQNNIPYAVSSLEWDTGFKPISTTPLSPEDSAADVSSVQGVGYIIVRDEFNKRGQKIGTKSTIISGLKTSVVVDPQVRYGGIYKYQVKMIALVTLPGADETGALSVMKGLVASSGATSRIILCTENVPPPPPTDLKFTWDRKEDGLRIMWSFPVNSQRDIKYFQVFRRKSVNDPFEIIRMYDFDDSIIPVDPKESISSDVIFKMKDPSTTMIDGSFTRDSSYIYALCSIDAHGFSSNYSQQFQVSFDRFANTVVLTYVSQAGAPKAYPNIFLREDAFLDVVKTSNFERMTIYFDPDYLQVFDKDEHDLRLLPWNDPAGVYKFLFINTDRQLSSVMNVNLDFRTSTEGKSGKGARRRAKRKLAMSNFTGLKPNQS